MSKLLYKALMGLKNIPKVTPKGLDLTATQSLIRHTGAGVGNAAFWDQTLNPLAGTGEWDRTRIGNFAINALLGAAGYRGLSSRFKDLSAPLGITALSMAPTKDLAVIAGHSVRDTADSIGRGADALEGLGHLEKLDKTVNVNGSGATGDWKLPATLGLLGAGGLGLGAYGLMRNRDNKEQGKIRVTLPTKDPFDNETVVELPIESMLLSNTAMQNLNRDVRRRLRSGSKERKLVRHPETGELIPQDEFNRLHGWKSASAQPGGATMTPPANLAPAASMNPNSTAKSPGDIAPKNNAPSTLGLRSPAGIAPSPLIGPQSVGNLTDEVRARNGLHPINQSVEEAAGQEPQVDTAAIEKDLKQQELDAMHDMDSVKHLENTRSRVVDKVKHITKASMSLRMAEPYIKSADYMTDVLNGDPDFYQNTWLGNFGKPLDWAARMGRGLYLRPAYNTVEHGLSAASEAWEGRPWEATKSLGNAALSGGELLANTVLTGAGAGISLGRNLAYKGGLGLWGNVTDKYGRPIAESATAQSMGDSTSPYTGSVRGNSQIQPPTITAADRDFLRHNPMIPDAPVKWESGNVTPAVEAAYDMTQMVGNVGGMFIPGLSQMGKPTAPNQAQMGWGSLYNRYM